MRKGWGEEYREGGGGKAGPGQWAWQQGGLSATALHSGDFPVYPQGSMSSVRARGQMDREEVQWEDIYANSSMSLLLGVLNIV